MVLNNRTGEPLRTAVIAVGRPGGVGTYGRHPVDDSGQFGFILFMKDDNNVYVFDSAGPPEMTVQKLPRFEFGQPMTVRVRIRNAASRHPPPIASLFISGKQNEDRNLLCLNPPQ